MLGIYWKYARIVVKRRNCSLEQFLLFSTIFCYLLLDFHVKIWTRFSRQGILWVAKDSTQTAKTMIGLVAHAILYETMLPGSDESYYVYKVYEIITKTCLFKFIENFTTKHMNISDKNSDIFHISAQNIDCGYSLEPPRRGGSNEYHNLCFWAEIRKIMYTPVNPSFTI